MRYGPYVGVRWIATVGKCANEWPIMIVPTYREYRLIRRILANCGFTNPKAAFALDFAVNPGGPQS